MTSWRTACPKHAPSAQWPYTYSTELAVNALTKPNWETALDLKSVRQMTGRYSASQDRFGPEKCMALYMYVDYDTDFFVCDMHLCNKSHINVFRLLTSTFKCKWYWYICIGLKVIVTMQVCNRLLSFVEWGGCPYIHATLIHVYICYALN